MTTMWSRFKGYTLEDLEQAKLTPRLRQQLRVAAVAARLSAPAGSTDLDRLNKAWDLLRDQVGLARWNEFDHHEKYTLAQHVWRQAMGQVGRDDEGGS